MNQSQFLPSEKCTHLEQEWGNLDWFAGAPLGNSENMTIGRCVIKEGAENPLHSHPNCEEVLVLVQGQIAHTIEEHREVQMKPGDVITIPPQLPHKARNIGQGDAIMFIAFSSAHRQFQLEE